MKKNKINNNLVKNIIATIVFLAIFFTTISYISYEYYIYAIDETATNPIKALLGRSDMPQEEYEGIEGHSTSGVEGTIEDQTEVELAHIKEFEHLSWSMARSYPTFPLFPIDQEEFNKDYRFYCTQHHTQYGNVYYGEYLGTNPETHIHTKITDNPNKYNKIEDPLGDLTTNAKIYVDESGQLINNYEDGSAKGYRDEGYLYAGGEQNIIGKVYTNWVYLKNEFKFDCEGNGEVQAYNSGGGLTTSGGGRITDGGMAFLFATLQKEGARSEDYDDDPMQHAVWEWLGQNDDKGHKYDPVAEVYDQYHKDAEESLSDPDKRIYAKPADNVGTTYSGGTYTIGPFEMSPYIRAKDYETDEGNLQDLMDNGYRGNLSLDDVQGTIIKWEAIFIDDEGNRKAIEIPKDQIPEPEEPAFYISFSESQLAGLTELLDIRFTYQIVHAKGEGAMWYGFKYQINFDQSNIWQPSGCTYKCPNHGSPSGACHHGNKGPSSTPYRGNCTHYWYTHSGITYDSKGNPHHYHTGYQSQTHYTTFICQHGHTHCFKFDYDYLDNKDYAQDGGSFVGELDNSIHTLTTRVRVPIKTRITIKKYIYGVIHEGEDCTHDDTFLGGVQRRQLDRNYKVTDEGAVKVERGDIVGFRIEIENTSRFPTILKVEDTLPDKCELVFMPDAIKNKSEIVVQPGTRNVYYVKVRVITNDGKYINKVEIITKNETDEKMRYTTWGRGALFGYHSRGYIVNTVNDSAKQVDLEKVDWDHDAYLLKHYNVSVDKYVYDVEHEVFFNTGTNGLRDISKDDGVDTTFREDDSRSVEALGVDNAEDYKKNHPVYVEYGDRVRYKIKVYNTCEPYVEDPGAAPYYHPDLVYVTVEDILPAGYDKELFDKERDITVDNTAKIEYDEGAGKITFKNIRVEAEDVTTITIDVVMNNRTKGAIEENDASIKDEIRDINKGPGTDDGIDDYCVGINESTHIDSKDYVKINDYDARIDKYISKYDPIMTVKNNDESYKITSESNAEFEEHIRYTYSEDEKKDHPLMAEKNEEVTYQIRVVNDSNLPTAPYNGDPSGSSLASGIKPWTQIRPTLITDYMQYGLTFLEVNAKMYKGENEDGTLQEEVTRYGDIAVTRRDGEPAETTIDGEKFIVHDFYVDETIILNPGEVLVYEVKVRVDESNMYLYKLRNKAEIKQLTNINYSIVLAEQKDRTVYERKDESTWPNNVAEQQDSSDYVRMKDLVIAGRVWIDNDPDGYYLETSMSPGATPYNNKDDKLKEDVLVKLYYVGDDGKGHLIRTTKTNEKGIYSFAFDENLSPYNGEFKIEGETGDVKSYESRQRVPKTMPKDPLITISSQIDTDSKDEDYKLNYKEGSTYAKYYIEFEYDGLYYKSTELYSNEDNIEKNSGTAPVDQKHQWTTENMLDPEKNYTNDSNAFEFWDDRKNFDNRYETIGYDIGYNSGKDIENTTTVNDEGADATLLSYDKREANKDPSKGRIDDEEAGDNTAHVSELLEEEELDTHQNRVMTARSFVKSTDEVRNTTTDLGNSYYGDDSNFGNTNLLFLYPLDKDTDEHYPQTEYLKYINLGLEKREKVDVSLVKDVYQVKTTVNGEEVIYEFDQYSPKTLEEIIKQEYKRYQAEQAYELELYKSDYDYRVNDYDQLKVRDYKTILSELNIEVTFKITLINNENTEDEPKLANKDIPMEVVIDEIAEYYDKSFVEYTDDAQKADKYVEFDHTKFVDDVDNPDTDYFKDWKQNADNGDGTGWDGKGSNYITMMKKYGDFLQAQRVKIAEAWLLEGEGEDQERVDLELYNKSLYNDKRELEHADSTADKKGGYNTLYIRGKDGKGITNKSGEEIKLAEGEKLEVYVKYLVDKEEISRTLKLEDEVTKKEDANKQIVDYGLEGISEINAYTTYYGSLSGSRQTLGGVVNYSDFYNQNDDTYYQELIKHYKHFAGYTAGTVDDDSNPSNIGEKPGISKLDSRPTGTSSIMFSEDPGEAAIWFEDDTFKTGIKFIVNEERRRTLSGKVWDDSRSSTVNDDSVISSDTNVAEMKKQYGGDGIYRDENDDKSMPEGFSIDVETNVKKLEEAQSNSNIRDLMKNTTSDNMKNKLGETSGDKYKPDEEYNFYDPEVSSDEDEFEKQDFLVDGVTVQLVEIVKVPIYDPAFIDENGNPKLFKLDENGQINTAEQVETDKNGYPLNDGEIGYPKFSEVRYYETSVKDKQQPLDPAPAPVKTKTGAESGVENYGKYELSGFKPGYYIVKFSYGNAEEDGTVTPEMQTFNGQDYKSTAYMPTVTINDEEEKGELESITVATGARYNPNKEVVEYPPDNILILDYVIDEKGEAIQGQYLYKANSEEGEREAKSFYEKYDEILKGLEYENRNDARDDEIERLDSISFSEVMTNAKAEILKGISSKTQYASKYDEKIAAGKAEGTAQIAETLLQTTVEDSDEVKWQVQSKDNMNKILAGETAMNAETITFYVKPERVASEAENYTYSGRKKLENEEKLSRDANVYAIEGIDFGLTYRPESQLTVDKEIEKITITTSDNDEIMVVAFKDYVNAQGNTELEADEKNYFDYSKESDGYESIALSSKNGRIKRVVDTNNSRGLNNLQYIFNQDWKGAKGQQGFFYINIDDEILQGCTIGIDYSLRVENISEIDRISRNLDLLRYKDNLIDDADTLVKELESLKYVEAIYNTFNTINFSEYELDDLISMVKNYSGSKTAEALLHKIWYNKDDDYDQDGEYRVIEKTMTKDQNNKYYGSFLGGSYYTNKVIKDTSDGSVIDTIVDIKVDKIIDYIDNDLVFAKEKNDSDNHRWTAVTSEALMVGDGKNGRLVANKAFSTGEGTTYDTDYEYSYLGTADDPTIKLYDKDSKEMVYDIRGKIVHGPTGSTDIDENRTAYTILDTDKVSYESGKASNLVISVDDRVVDDYTTYGYTMTEGIDLLKELQQIFRRALGKKVDLVGKFTQEDWENIEDNPNTAMANASLSRYLEPRMDVSLSAEIVPIHDSKTQKTNMYNLNNGTLNQYAGKIILSTERVISSETDTDNLAFENIAEILQFSITNGRRTNFKTTLGNTEVTNFKGVYEESLTGHMPNPEYPDDPTEEDPYAPKDPDTSAVEVITLSPPTGLDRISRIIKNVAIKTSNTLIPIVITIAIIALVGGGTYFIRYRIKHHRIK